MCNKLVNNSTMKWAIVLACACAVACLPSDQSHCGDNSQCNVGYYCNLDHFICSKCLSCEDLKRAALPVVSSCIRSIAECGPCLPGLVADPSGNLDPSCVPADSVAGPDLTYLWITLAVVLLAVALMVGMLIYALRNTDTFKMVSFTRASLQSPCARACDVEPSLAPPPYNTAAGFLPVGPTSPPLELPVAPQEPNSLAEDSSRPFIKRADSRHARAPRERASNQEAQVFNKPSYVRGPELPPSYDSTVNGEGSPALLDEETMESPWTPSDDANNNYGQNSGVVSEPGSAAELSSLLSEAHGTTLVRPPERTDRDDATPSKVVCVRQDSNNNGHSRLEAGEGSAAAFPPAAAAPAPTPPQLTELNLNITVQHNEFKLIRSPDHRLDCFL